MSKLELIEMDKEIRCKQDIAFKNIKDELKNSKDIVDNIGELTNSKFFKVLNLLYLHHDNKITKTDNLHIYKH